MGEMLKIGLPLLLLAGLIEPARGESYCSLVVQVFNRDFQEVEAVIRVREADGTLHAEDNRPGGARFCALGTDPVDILVGDESCNQVIVRNVQLLYSSTVTSKVLYDRSVCLNDPPPDLVPQCKVLFRVIDSQGRPVERSGARLALSGGEYLPADSRGRVYTLLRRGTALAGTVISPGFREEDIRVECPRAKDIEVKVRLRRLE